MSRQVLSCSGIGERVYAHKNHVLCVADRPDLRIGVKRVFFVADDISFFSSNWSQSTNDVCDQK